jgi:photosystem II stability/assembly factor-like uncharacterized protein
MRTSLRRTLLAPALAVAVLSASALTQAAALQTVAFGSCPAGYHSVRVSESESGAASELLRIARRDAAASRPDRCIADKHPESPAEAALARRQMIEALYGPGLSPPPGAMRRAVEQSQALARARSSVAGASGSWRPYGSGPLITNDPQYQSVNGEGLVNLSGRVDSLDYDPVSKRLFASVGTGGVWMSENLGTSWRSIGDTLPTQTTGALAWSPAGALVVVTGEPLQAGFSHVGFGVFRTTDLGKTWQQSVGVPDGILGFQVAVDPTNPSVVYVATSKGLFRSTDAGVTFTNTRLPTGSCAGKTDDQKCLLANMVTDVVVQSPDSFGHKGAKVLAVVGYRAGARAFPQDGDVIESEGNGLYRSPTGAPGTFTKLNPSGFAPPNRLGRTELGLAVGPEQNHDVVYAIVEDAEVFNGGYPIIDTPEDAWAGVTNTFLNGIYVSKDFGATWTLMADAVTISENPTTGSALVGTGQALLFAPGIQAWYNEWIKPDPTRQTADGIPKRVTFGLEEVWQNDHTTEPADTRTTFHVIGRYYAGDTCLFLDLGEPYCPTGQPIQAETTTHPDQHDALYIPDGNGGVTLIVGNDGGTFKQHVAKDVELDNTKWGTGANDGYNTLLPYNIAVANDGTVWFGLQDNGSGKIDPATRKQYMTFGGDGFYVAVDPDNANYAWSEVTFASMRVTTDGGKTWTTAGPQDPINPTTSTNFSNPFVMDPLDPNHLMTAGRQVQETTSGPSTCISVDTQVQSQQLHCTWLKVFDLGTRAAPGVAPNAAYDFSPVLPPGSSPPQSMSALDLRGDAAYVGFCQPCGLLNASSEFTSGIATNVGGTAPAKRMTSDGWHVAAAKGLPERMITAIAIDPNDPKNVTVTLGGYEAREWRPPGSFGDKNKKVGTGHVFRSTDAGETFIDVSGDLPDTPAVTVVRRGQQLLVGTNLGAFISSDLSGSKWSALGTGLPAVLVTSLKLAPDDPNVLYAATFGRGVYAYHFPKTAVLGEKKTRPATKPAKLPSTGLGTDVTAWALVAVAGALAVRLRRRRDPVL